MLSSAIYENVKRFLRLQRVPDALSLISCCILIALPAIAAASDTLLTVESPAGEHLGGGVSGTFAPPTAIFGTPTSVNGLTFEVRPPGQSNSYTLTFGRYFGAPLKPGVFTLPAASQSAGTLPALFLMSTPLAPWSQQQPPGTLEIKRATYDGTGAIVAFWATWEVHAPGATTSFRGELKYSADLPAIGANQPPVVQALAYLKRVALGSEVTLHVAAGDDDLPTRDAFTSEWTLVSGPAPVEFLNSRAVATTAVFQKSGEYVLRLTASDTVHTRTADVTYSVYDAAERSSFVTKVSESGGQQRYTPVNADFVVSGNIHSGASIRIAPMDHFGTTGPPQSYDLIPVSGSTLGEGDYDLAHGGSGEDGSRLRLMKHTVSEEREITLGRLQIRELTHGEDGEILSLWMTWTDVPSSLRVLILSDFRYRVGNTVPEAVNELATWGSPRVISGEPVRLLWASLDETFYSSPPTLQWSVASGPGSVTFDWRAPIQFATLSGPGAYVLRLTRIVDGRTLTSDINVVQEDVESVFGMRRGYANSGSRSHVYGTAAELQISAISFDDGNTVIVNVESIWSTFPRRQLEFRAPESSGLGVGRYTGVLAIPQPDASRGAFQIRGEGMLVFPEMRPEFVINEITWDELGTLTSFSADFTYWAANESSTYELAGHVRWRTAPAPARTNLPPTAEAGKDAAVQVGTFFHLEGKMNDDAYPLHHKLTGRWTQIAGPEVSLLMGSVLDDSLFLHEPGTYRFRLTADDGEFTVTDEVTIIAGTMLTGKYEGLVTVDGELVGSVSFFFSRSGAFTGVLRAGPYVLPLRSPGPFGSKDYRMKDGRLVHFEMEFASEAPSISGFIYDGDVRADFTATQSAQGFLPTADATSMHAGQYTFQLSHAEAGDCEGLGFGALVISKFGAARLRRVLPDGTSFSKGLSLVLDDTLPVAVMIKKRELVGGTLSVTSTGNLLGEWKRSSAPTGFHTLGDDLPTMQVKGGRYNVPAKDQNAITLSSASAPGTVSFDMPEWPAPLSQTVSLAGAPTILGENGLKIKIERSNGMIKGVFRDAYSGDMQKFRGAILQDERSAVGHFVRGNTSGSFQLVAD